MNTRKFMKEEILFPKDIVNMSIDLMPKLTILELERLILFAEMEIDDRAHNGSYE